MSDSRPIPSGKSNLVRYPGSKARLAPWILDHMPPHERYVEPFGGAASVLFAKPQSTVEVLNDADGHLVRLYEAVRDSPGELAEWLRGTPYSRRLHDRWQQELARGTHPDDLVEHAGRVAYVHTTSIAGDRAGGFATRKRDRDPTNHFGPLPARVKLYADRLRSVVIENLDVVDCIQRYDRDPDAEQPGDVVMYFDPPYVGAGEGLYTESVDHSEFIDALLSCSANWLVSYQQVPDRLAEHDSVSIVSRDVHNHLRAGAASGEHDETDREHLVANYDLENARGLTEQTQMTLTEVSGSE